MYSTCILLYYLHALIYFLGQYKMYSIYRYNFFYIDQFKYMHLIHHSIILKCLGTIYAVHICFNV